MSLLNLSVASSLTPASEILSRPLSSLEISNIIVKDRNFSPKISAFPNKSRRTRGNISVLDYTKLISMIIIPVIDVGSFSSLLKIAKAVIFLNELNRRVAPTRKVKIPRKRLKLKFIVIKED